MKYRIYLWKDPDFGQGFYLTPDYDAQYAKLKEMLGSVGEKAKWLNSTIPIMHTECIKE